MTKLRCPLPFAGTASLKDGLPRTSRPAADPSRLQRPLTVLRGVGPATAREAEKLGLKTLQDLLFHFPFRHEDFTNSRRIGELKWGEEATVACRLESISRRPTRRRNLRLLVATVADESGFMEAVWFNQDYLLDTLAPGDRLMLRGRYDGSSGSFVVKGHELLTKKGGGGLHTAGLVPVYPTTERISVKRLRAWLDAVRPLAMVLADPLPAWLRVELDLPGKADAVLAMHFPRSRGDLRAARRRLVFEELLLMQLGLAMHRRFFGERRRGEPLGAGKGISRRFLENLPFSLTPGQERACREIDADLAGEGPMQRLLQGDVGAGKTVVAVYALLRAVENGCQAALMAPTEVLAEQHYLGLERLLAGLGIDMALLTSGLKASERRRILAVTAAGEVDIVVGTHALIQGDVSFRRLALIVVDEQHRFGVRQREQLARKATREGITPHVLHVTATPIPRTLALTLYGDLDVSIVDTMPPGRQRTVTRWVPESKRPQAYDFIRGQLDRGRQCFIVCPLVEESQALEAPAVEAEAERLAAGELRGYRLGILHGQMPAAEKRRVMQRFQAGELQVLVATTVIEVGVDIANATVMVVEEADRFGLAQLHQLRGRVGRGRHKSYCLLFGEGATEAARRRLQAMEEVDDGFRLADIDLEIRGEGELFGIRQSGLPDLKLARLTRDRKLLALAREQAERIIGDDPALGRPENLLLREEVRLAFGDSVKWLDRI